MNERAQRHLNGFLDALEAAGIAMPPVRRVDFLRALTLIELLSIDDLYWAARITLVSTIGQTEIFDPLFDAWFRGGDRLVESVAEAAEDKEADQRPEKANGGTPPPIETGVGTGRQASMDELLLNRALARTGDDERELCRRITRAADIGLPRQKTHRTARLRRPGMLDMRRVLSHMRRSGGEVIHLSYRRHPLRIRRVLMLIDVSGSLRTTSPDALRCAHALMKASPRMEVFAFGTRLTRITKALAKDDIDQALLQLSDAIFDFDGGTRIGPTFEDFLRDNRLQTLARGALVLVVSDGLERGDVSAMKRATEQLARLAHRLLWLTPLMSDPAYRPATRGMKAILGSLDRLGDASSLASLCDEIEHLDKQLERRRRRGVAAMWTKPAPNTARRSDAHWIGRT